MTHSQLSRMTDWYWQYKRCENASLLDVYKKPSDAKRNAYYYCRKVFASLNGNRFRIISHTAQFFTVAFVYNDPKDYSEMFYVNTGRNVYTCPVSDIFCCDLGWK